MKIETIYFSATDTCKLTGIKYQSETKTDKIVISVHGMVTNCMKKREDEIAKKVTDIGIDYLTFNNRGHDLMNYTYKESGDKIITGTSYEEVTDCYFDILGAINYVVNLGYKEIYLLGHSLGSTKVVYTYQKLKENKEEKIVEKIKGIILLSLIDIPNAFQIYLRDTFPQMLTYAKNMEREKMNCILMPEEAFIHPISVKTFLSYTRDSQAIDFARYSVSTEDFEIINQIQIPLCMRWGNKRELILQEAEELCEFMKSKLTNPKLDIGYINGADHSYTGKEEILGKEIQTFLKEN